MSLLSDHKFEAFGRPYGLARVEYTGAAATFLVDQSASAVASIEPSSSAPAATIASGDSNFEKTVTLAAGSPAAVVTVAIAYSGGTISSSKPASRA
jgi:hypothetical protein